MKLDYQIIHNINNYYKDGFANYDYVNTEIWISNESLCKLINKIFNLDICLNIKKEIDKRLSMDIWHYLSDNGKKLHLIGIYGDNFLNDWKY